MTLIDYWEILLIITICSFIIKLLDETLGIGFGTTFTPILLIFIFNTSIIVPSVLLSEVFAGIAGMIFHALFKNVKLGKKQHFRSKTQRQSKVYSLPNNEHLKSLNSKEIATINNNNNVFKEGNDVEEGIIIEDDNDITLDEDQEIEELKLENKSLKKKIKNLTTDTKVISILSIVGILSTIVAAVINVIFENNELFNFIVKIYIGLMVISMGVLIFLIKEKKVKTSYKRTVILGIFGGFNKGISGGGYTPITVIGQLIIGREEKSALASTTFAKTSISFVGILTYIIAHIAVSLNTDTPITWEYLGLAPFLIGGAVLAAPIGAFIIKKVQSKLLKSAIGTATILLGTFTLIHEILIYTKIWNINPILDITHLFMN